jgi:hypothetical protein
MARIASENICFGSNLAAFGLRQSSKPFGFLKLAALCHGFLNLEFLLLFFSL